MAASPPEIVARVLGGAVIAAPSDAPPLPGPAAHDGAGLRFVFRPPSPDPDRGPPPAWAIDVERRDQDAPPALAARLGLTGADFFRAWTGLEVTAKLTGIPIAALAARGAPAGTAPEIVRADTATHWIAVGRTATPADGDAPRPCASG